MPATRPEFARIRLAFGKSAYFRALPPATLDTLAAASTLVHCPDGPLHGPNEAAQTFWLVLEGSVIVSWPSAAESVPVAAIGVGSFYCASSLVEGGMTVTEARAERHTVCATMPSERFRAIARADPAVAALVPKLLLQRFEAALSFAADAVSAKLPQRLARRLLAHGLAVGQDLGSTDVELRISQTDLARMLGASRSKVNEALRRLQEVGLIRIGYGRIVLVQCRGLSEIAGGWVPKL
ncbi:Crp/Fnr family transcriptional regulator [Caenimonas aquaedulcis]|uniref:Crp/Fnr family transcriptional regulator n=1 Tax=Caenimonas aquaedulcis TaxID=2793270 RepID=A0A931H8Y5_9BURK|nr:Crp/Fnr family transcriptional regulator [Caenimonas aquaedulcis]MBG9390577.1 Crp/Fnr family transcriptional regulator [Caenimonas aquaedulcis]